MKRLLAFLCVVGLVLLGITGVSSATTTTGNGLGDANLNGQIGADDALLVLQKVVGKVELTPMQSSAADMDCSDDIGSADALQILRQVVGKTVQFTGLTDQTFTIGSVYASKYTADTDFGRAWQQAVAKAEQKYGVSISVVPLNLTEESDSLFFYDMIEVSVNEVRSLARKGKLMDLNNNVVFPEDVRKSGSTASCQMGDGLYGVASKAMSANPMGIAINKDLVSRYAPNAFAKLQEQFEKKEWTWEALTALAEEYQAGSKQKGVMMSNTNIIGQAIVANAGYEVKFLPDGSGAISSIATDEGIAALTYTKELFNSGAYVYESNVNAMFEKFREGKIPMVVYYLNDTVSAAADRDFEISAMPFPIGPAQNDYVMCTFNSPAYAVPAGMSEYGNAYAMVLSALAEADAAIADGWVADAKQKGYDALGQAVYRWATANTSFDFSSGPFTGAVGGPVDGSVLNPDMKPSVDVVNIKNVIQQEVDAYYGPFYKK